MLLILVTSSSRSLSFSLSARTERGPRGRGENSGEEGEGAEPLEGCFLAMTLPLDGDVGGGGEVRGGQGG